MASITFHVPDQEPLEIDLEGKEQVSVGRGPDNDVVIDDVSMSGSHALVRNVDGEWQLQDLESTNGTFVNGDQISETALPDGAQLMFGSVGARYHAPGADAGSEEAGVEGESATHVHAAEIAEASHRPADFKDLSPIEKVEKKDVIAQVAVVIGIVAIVAALAMIAVAATMTAA